MKKSGRSRKVIALIGEYLFWKTTWKIFYNLMLTKEEWGGSHEKDKSI